MKTMIKRQLLIAIALLFSASVFADALKVSDFKLGETLTFQSTVLDEERKLNIYVPASYHQNKDKRYPVIYLLDGSASEDFIHVAGITQFASFSWINMMPEAIVVGVANVDRKRDFTYPSTYELDQKEYPTSGGAYRFIKALKKDVKPLINQRYRTNQTSLLIGQSLGGLLASTVVKEQPELFTHYMIISPSLWWDKEILLQSKMKPLAKHQKVFVAVGKEGSVMERVAKQLAEKIQQTNPDNQVDFAFFEQLNHGDTLHLAAYKGFKALFSK